VLRERFGWDSYLLHAERDRIKSITKFVTPSETLDVIDYAPRIAAFWNVPPRPVQNSSSARSRIYCGSRNTGTPAS
jgi:hypothetical protein